LRRYLLSLHVSPADEQGRTQVGKLAKEVQKQTGKSVALAYVDQGYTGEQTAEAAKKQKIELAVVKLPEAKRGFVLLPRRWVGERSFAWPHTFPPPGEGLRAPGVDAKGNASSRIRDRHAGSSGQLERKCITLSSNAPKIGADLSPGRFFSHCCGSSKVTPQSRRAGASVRQMQTRPTGLRRTQRWPAREQPRSYQSTRCPSG